MASTGQDLSVSSLLRRYRLAAGLSQAALAERAGLSLDAVSAIERGLRRPRRPTLHALARALGLSTVQLAGFEVTLRRTGRPRAGVHPPGLPLATTALLGREHDVAVVSYLLRVARERLLTLTGTGGVGKTRLAQQTALEVADVFPDGVIWVDLAPLRDPELVAPTLARQVGVLDTEATPLQERLVAALRQKRLLLVLDNFEQVLAARIVPQSLLATCPEVSILVTSRAALRLMGEQEYVVAPLRLPGPLETALDVVEQVPAVALFIQRARAAEPGLALTGATAPMVVELCRRFDGLPLAIELAARLVRILPPAAMLEQIRRREEGKSMGEGAGTLDLLMAGAWMLPERQQTLRTALAWSYDLLAPREQALFRRLCIFAGGWTLQAAEAVCGYDGPASDDVRVGLDALDAQSLIQVTEVRVGAARRYSVLETVREYGLERLDAGGEMDAVQERHATWCLRLAEQAEPELAGPEQGTWLERLEREHDNLRAALAWARMETGGTSTTRHAMGLRLAAALRRFWEAHGHLSEGRAWFATFLAHDTGPELVQARARALHGAGWMAVLQGDHGHGVPFLESSLALHRQCGDMHGAVAVLNCLGAAAHDLGNYARAVAFYEDGLALAREHGNSWGTAAALTNLGNVLYDQGHYERAAAVLDEGLAVLQLLGDRRVMAMTLINLAEARRGLGEEDQAVQLYGQAIALSQELGDRSNLAYALEGVARIAADRGHMERVARLCGAAATLREAVGAPAPASYREVHDRSVEAARAALGGAAFAACWATGRARPLESVLDEASAIQGDASQIP